MGILDGHTIKGNTNLWNQVIAKMKLQPPMGGVSNTEILRYIVPVVSIDTTPKQLYVQTMPNTPTTLGTTGWETTTVLTTNLEIELNQVSYSCDNITQLKLNGFRLLTPDGQYIYYPYGNATDTNNEFQTISINPILIPAGTTIQPHISVWSQNRYIQIIASGYRMSYKA